MEWSEKPFDLTDTFQWSGFMLSNYSLLKSISNYAKTGDYDKLVVRFHLIREYEHFLLDIYTPAVLFVVTSFLTFWIEVPAAVSPT